MAADQRKKRANTANLVGCTSRDQYRVKRKRLELPQHELNMRPNISLEWDNKKKSVVSKKEQIGIPRRHLNPFIETNPHGNNALADVFTVPQEIFELKNLSAVLSYEVWMSHLSEKERSFLSKFLPKEADPDTIVQELLAGNNFDFGNPFEKWGSSLCLGKLHPDNVVHEEQSLKVCKKSYYSDLEKYHNNMIDNLHTWKEKWASCKDPEVDILQNISRSRMHTEKSLLPSEIRFYDTEENLVATPESCSWANSEKAYSSDNQNVGMVQGESQRRKGFLNKAPDTSSGELKVVAIPRKGEKLQKRNFQYGDGAKYMSYIKVSKGQHERVKSSMKHASNSIQPRSLSNVLGSIEALNVQPFERFEEEERKKLHDYWLNLANKDIPECLVVWEKRQFHRLQVTQTLGENIKQKVELVKAAQDEEKEVSQVNLMELSDESDEEIPPTSKIEGMEKDDSDYLIQGQVDNEEAVHEMPTEMEDEKERKTDYIYEEQTHNEADMTEEEEDDNDADVPNHVFIQDNHQQLCNTPRVNSMIELSDPDFLPDPRQHPITPLNTNPRINSTDVNTSSAIVSGFSGNLSHVDIPLHGSYYQSSAANNGYASTQELSLEHPQFIPPEQPVQMLDHRQDKDSGRELSFFNSNTNQDQNELLQSLMRVRSSSLPYHHEQRHTGLHFQPRNDHLLIDAHQSLPLDIRQKRLNDLYMQQHNIQENIYSDGGRFATMSTRHDHHLPVNIHNFAPIQPQGLSQNWYTSENGARDVWPPFEGVNHNSRSSSDQTLFSVLNECNELRPVNYDPMGSTRRFIQTTGNYNGVGGSSSNAPNPLSYLSGHEPAGGGGGLKINNLGCIGLSQQNNSGVQESMIKPFSRSWNQ
ncbi:hypothetical protein ACJIZ3_015210 [Penstemon smallii]|uniref:DEUBAD domain-containing protein n=1 Tax=Penstemon smallii TaxID=265156 RepID=A0ABD3RLV5_9LAMI